MAFRKPFQAEARHHVRHGDLEQMPALSGDLQKTVVSPEHRPVLHIEDHHGKRHTEDRVAVPLRLLLHGGSQIIQHLPLLTLVDETGIEKQQGCYQQLDDAQLPMPTDQGQDGKKHQYTEIHTHGRPEEAKKGRIAAGFGVRFLFHDISSQIGLVYQIIQAFTIHLWKFHGRIQHMGAERVFPGGNGSNYPRTPDAGCPERER